MRTLIVEDDFTSRVFLQSLLLPYGEAHCAANGREAVEAFRASLAAGTPYDLVCLDILMPGMGGILVLEQMRAAERGAHRPPQERTRIIMVTVLANKHLVLRAAEKGCDAYLVKPVSKTALESKLAELGLIPAPPETENEPVL